MDQPVTITMLNAFAFPILLLGLLIIAYAFIVYVRAVRAEDPDADLAVALFYPGALLAFIGLAGLMIDHQPTTRHGPGTVLVILAVSLLPLLSLLVHSARWPFACPKPPGMYRVPLTLSLLQIGAVGGLAANVWYGSIFFAVLLPVLFSSAAALIAQATDLSTWRAFIRDENFIKANVDQAEAVKAAAAAQKDTAPEPARQRQPLTEKDRIFRLVRKRTNAAEAIAQSIQHLRRRAQQDPENAQVYIDLVTDLESGDWKNWERD